MKDLHARRPVDREAARAVSEGVHEDLKFPADPYASETPIPTETLPRRHKNLTGQRKGRFTVIGYWGRNKSGHSGTAARHRWVVRCDCGTFTVRREQKLARPGDDMCNRCLYVAALRQRSA